MQLDSVGKMCPGYSFEESLASIVNENVEVSCETCIHWKKQRCQINLFDTVLTSLDQT